MVVYADILFIINFVFNYMILFLFGKCTLTKYSVKKLLISSALGAVCVVLLFCSNLNGLQVNICKLAVAGGMMMIAYGIEKKTFIRQLLLFFFILSAISGMCIIIIMTIGNSFDGYIKNGILYFNINSKIFFLSLLVSYPLTYFIAKLLKRKQTKKIYTLQIRWNSKQIKTISLFDSGNLLKEPITRKPVIIIEWDEIKDLFDGIEFDNLSENIEKYKLWIIPYHSLGNKNSTIFAFLADNIYILEDKLEFKNIFVGISKDRLSNNKEYHALLNAELL